MRRAIRVGFVILFVGAAPLASAETPADGQLLERRPCPAVKPRAYDQYRDETRQFLERETALAKEEGVSLEGARDVASRTLAREEFEARESFSAYECFHILYGSDGLKVAGYVWKPKGPAGRKWPLVVANRGGNREFGKLTPQSFFYPFVSDGFVVIASQYRGVEGGEGREEFGGADVDDVLNLLPLARSLGYVDMKNVFLVGASRGGMMTLLALKRGMPVNAAAVVSGMYDLEASARERPALVEAVWKELIPRLAERRAEALKERSAVAWPEAIHVPVLLAHGTADWRVSASQALDMAKALQSAGRIYELVMYSGDDHGTNGNRVDRERRTLAWFRRFMK